MNNYNYIYSILALYFKNESEDKKTILNIIRYKDHISLRFNMNEKNDDKSSYEIPIEVVNTYITDIIKKYRDNMLVIDENFKEKNGYYNYSVKFKSGRKLTFSNFSLLEINNLRNILFDINIRKDEIRVNIDNEKEEIKMNYKPRLQETGFVSFKSIFLMTLLFSDIFMISLWICKLLMK